MAALLGLLIGALAVLLGPPTPANAHAVLLRTSPAAGSTVASAPTEVVLSFSEPVRLIAGKIKILGPDGSRADNAAPSVRGNDVHVPLRSGSRRGTYLVSYRVVSADSHPVGGSITFSVGVPSPRTPSEGVDVARGDRTVSVLMGAARFLGFAGLVLLVGAALVLDRLWPRRLPRTRPARLAFAGIGAVLLSAVAELYLQAPYSGGTSLFGAGTADLQSALAGQFGAAHLIRIGALAAIAVLLRPLLRGHANRADRALLAILSVAALATWPLAGHPGASPAPTLTVAADIAHLAAVSVWLGGLVMLAGFLLRQANASELESILPVWSRWAMLAVAVLALTGTAQTLVEVGSIRALLDTTYGRLVLTKIGLLAVVLAVAAYSRRLARARLAAPVAVHAAVGAPTKPGQPSEPVHPPGLTTDGVRRRRRLRTSVLVELAIAAVVLTIAAALVQTSPARTPTADSAAPPASGPTSTTITGKLAQVQVDIDPGRTGPNQLHLFAYTPAGAPLMVLEWRATAALPAQGIEPLQATLLPITDNHATGQIDLPSPGVWELSITVRVSDIDQETLTQNIAIG